MSTDNNTQSDNEVTVTSSLDLPEYLQEFLNERKQRAHELADIVMLVAEHIDVYSPALDCAFRLAQDLAVSLDLGYMVRLAQGKPLHDVLDAVRITALGRE